MSGIIGHVMYAVLGAKAAAARRLPVASLIERHWSSYLAGSYLGADIQTMPEAICVDTGKEIGYGTVPLDRSPLTGGKVRPYMLTVENRQYRPSEIHEIFYGRSHLTFGWGKQDQNLTLPWDHLPDFCIPVVEDALELFGPAERPLAYVLGWMTHLVGDGLIKSVAPGVMLNLLGGKYNSKNRPIQDLFTFHEIGRKELRLNWPALLADLAATPVEAVQLHFMRTTEPRGQLARSLPEGWAPAREGLLRAVLLENRRYLKSHQQQILKEMALKRTGETWQCCPALTAAAGGLSYAQMIEAAEAAHFRHALWQIAESVANLFGQVSVLVPALGAMPEGVGPSWAELTRRWQTS